VLGIVLSVGAIPALVPIIIIIILIAAAAGLTRGTDFFALFGIDALLGLASGIGRGGTGKGLVGRSYGSGSKGRKYYIAAGSKVVPKPLKGVIKEKYKAHSEKSKYVKSMITNTVTGGASSGAAGAAVPNPVRAPGGKVNMAVNQSSVFTKPTPLGSRVKNSMKGAIVKNAPKIAFGTGGIVGYLIYKQVMRQPKNPQAKQLKKQAKQYKKQVKQFKKNNPGQYKNMKEQYKDQWEKAHNPNYGARTKTQKIKDAFATINDPQTAAMVQAVLEKPMGDLLKAMYVMAVEKIANSAIEGTEKIQKGRVAQKYAGKNTMPPLSVGVDQLRLQEMKDEKAKIIDSRDIDKFSGSDWLSLWGASFHSDIDKRKRTWYEDWKKVHP